MIRAAISNLAILLNTLYQEDDVVEIRVGEFPKPKEYKKLLAAAEKKAESKRKEKAAEAKKEDEEKNRRPRSPRASRTPLTVEFESQKVYQFKHDGRPASEGAHVYVGGDRPSGGHRRPHRGGEGVGSKVVGVARGKSAYMPGT